MKRLSVIVPLRNEENNVAALANGIRSVLQKLPLEYELIFVDDGSIDKTFAAVKAEAAADARVIGLSFRRNFGQTAAMKAGFEQATGDVCITMDGDLQHDPRQIPEFLAKIDQGYDLVCSYRVKRNDSWLRRIPSRAANCLARLFTALDIRDFGSTYRAYRADIAKELPILGEMHRFVPVFAAMLTNRITEIPITTQPRLHGKSKYGIGRTFRVLSDLIVLLFFAGFFNRPVHIFGYISLLLGLPGFTILGWLSIQKIVWDMAIMDSGPLFFLGVMLCLVAGQLFTTGIVCEYLIRVYYNGKRRPYMLAETTIPSAHRRE